MLQERLKSIRIDDDEMFCPSLLHFRMNPFAGRDNYYELKHSFAADGYSVGQH